MVTVKVLLVPLVIAAGRVMTPLIAGRPPRVSALNVTTGSLAPVREA
ncbi:hypothetical protein AB5I41_30860 [Sphingomonas sp. MMS24-JH45]